MGLLRVPARKPQATLRPDPQKVGTGDGQGPGDPPGEADAASREVNIGPRQRRGEAMTTRTVVEAGCAWVGVFALTAAAGWYLIGPALGWAFYAAGRVWGML